MNLYPQLRLDGGAKSHGDYLQALRRGESH